MELAFDKDGKAYLTNPDEIKDLDNMIRGIAYRYNNWAGLKAEEDIIPTLWCKAMKMINFKKSEITKDYIARGCYYGCIDLYNQKKKDNESHFPMDPTSLDWVRPEDNSKDDSGDKSDSPLEGSLSDSGEGFEDNLLVDSIIQLFPEGSTERLYVELISKWVGLNDATPDEAGYKRKDYKISQRCGYASDTSSGYRSMKYRVKDKIRENYKNYDFIQ